MPSESHPIACHIHDYVEIACLFKLKIRLRLTNGAELIGVAQDTVTRPDRIEVIQLAMPEGAVDVALHEIAVMQAVTQNPHFDRIDFAS